MDSMGDISFLSRRLVSRDLLNKEHILGNLFLCPFCLLRILACREVNCLIKKKQLSVVSVSASQSVKEVGS